MSRVKIKRNGAAELKRAVMSLPTAMTRALNETATGMRTDAVRQIRSSYTLKAGETRKGMKVVRASRENLRAGISVEGGGLPLIQFKHKPQKLTADFQAGRRPKVGAQVQVKKNSGLSLLPHVFKARMATGHKGLFRRGLKKGYFKTAPRTPIHELFGPGPPNVLSQKEAAETIRRLASTRWTKSITRLVKWADSKGL